MRTNRHNAFTLLEVILAITLVLGLLGGAMSFYRHVADVRDDVLADAEFSRTVRLVMDRMTAELQSLRVDDTLPLALSWIDTELQFTAVTLPSAAAWAPEAEAESAPPTQDMRLLIYSLRIVIDDDGEPVNRGLQRLSTAALALPPVDPDEEELLEPAPELLAESIKFIRFRYFRDDGVVGLSDNDWVDLWTGPGPPTAVEITLGATPKDDDMEVDDYLLTCETFRRIVFIPVS